MWSSPSRACYLQAIGDFNIPSQFPGPYKLKTAMTSHKSFRGSWAGLAFPLACLRTHSKSLNSFVVRRHLHPLSRPLVEWILCLLPSFPGIIALFDLFHHLINIVRVYALEMVPHCILDQKRKLMPRALIDLISNWSFLCPHFDLIGELRLIRGCMSLLS